MKKELNIEVDIRNKNDFVSEYNDNTLSPSLKKYLLNEIAGYDINSKINLNIDCKFELTDDQHLICRKNYNNKRYEVTQIRKNITIENKQY